MIEWIPVTERLPELDFGDVLITTAKGCQEVLFFSEGEFYFDNAPWQETFPEDPVTHWAYINPPPPNPNLVC